MRIKVEVKAENGKEEAIMEEVRKMVRKINHLPGIKGYQITIKSLENDSQKEE
ncbi:MAG: hypothetical protein MJ117_04275 [Lachnospiraceae bacterium]|nr:hypothetical protein [Lachnospiraceae bacterium]